MTHAPQVKRKQPAAKPTAPAAEPIRLYNVATQVAPGGTPKTQPQLSYVKREKKVDDATLPPNAPGKKKRK